MVSKPSADEYERLVERLVRELVPAAGGTTDMLERDVRVSGRSTTNQIDVVWDLTDSDGNRSRIVFEARSYARRVDQLRLHAFRSVVDDIQDLDRPVTGVMVTTAGYQSGARGVASTYGLVVLELREPNEKDLAGRAHEVHVTTVAQMPVIRDVRFEATETAAEPEALRALAVVPMTVVDGVAF